MGNVSFYKCFRLEMPKKRIEKETVQRDSAGFNVFALHKTDPIFNPSHTGTPWYVTPSNLFTKIQNRLQLILIILFPGF